MKTYRAVKGIGYTVPGEGGKSEDFPAGKTFAETDVPADALAIWTRNKAVVEVAAPHQSPPGA